MLIRKLDITSSGMNGYETTATPIRIDLAQNKQNTWIITSMENYLGSQLTEETQTFTLDGAELTVKGDSYEENYVKCTE